MGWMNDVKVVYKLAILAVIGLLAMAAVGITGNHYLGQASLSIDKLSSDELQSVRHIGEERVIRRKIQVDVLELVRQKDAAGVQQKKGALEKDYQDYEKNWKAYEEIAQHDASEAPLLPATRKAWEDYQKMAQQVTKLMEDGKYAEANTYYDQQYLKAFNVLRDRALELQKMIDEESTEVVQKSEANMANAIKIMLGVTAVSVVVLVLACIWNAREITGPLEKMMLVCKRLGEGDFRITPRTVTRGDEFGQMADVLVAMRDSMNKLMHHMGDSTEQIADLIGAIQKDTAGAVESMQQGRSAVAAGAQSVEGLREVFGRIRDLVNGVSEQVEVMTSAIDVVTGDTDSVTKDVVMINNHGKKVSEEMQSVSAATEQQSASAEEIASASDALAKLAQEMQLSLKKFQF